MSQQNHPSEWLDLRELDISTRFEMFQDVSNDTCLGHIFNRNGERGAICGRSLARGMLRRYYDFINHMTPRLSENDFYRAEAFFRNLRLHGPQVLCPEHQDQYPQLCHRWYERHRRQSEARRRLRQHEDVQYADWLSHTNEIPHIPLPRHQTSSPPPSAPQPTPVRPGTGVPVFTPPEAERSMPSPWGRLFDARQPRRKCHTQAYPSVSSRSGENSSPHVPRRELPDRCPVCCAEIEKEKSNLLRELVWCKGGCGHSLHSHCFEGWKETLLRNAEWDFGEGSPRDIWKKITCVTCRAGWEPPCSCDTHMLPQGYTDVNGKIPETHR